MARNENARLASAATPNRAVTPVIEPPPIDRSMRAALRPSSNHESLRRVAEPHKRCGPLEITFCGGGFSRACGASSALASADLYPTFSYPRLTPNLTTNNLTNHELTHSWQTVILSPDNGLRQ
jgi:hypothetical protein